jgi:hypothetical protein
MARKPNYGFERMERERLKAAENARKTADMIRAIREQVADSESQPRRPSLPIGGRR